MIQIVLDVNGIPAIFRMYIYKIFSPRRKGTGEEKYKFKQAEFSFEKMFQGVIWAIEFQRDVMKTVIFVLLVFWANMAFTETLEVDDKDQVAALLKVQQGIDAMSEAVMSCMDSGREHKVCMCKSKDLFAKFSATVDELFVSYPDLKNHDLVGFKEPGGMYVTLSMEGTQKQAQMLLNCNQ